MHWVLPNSKANNNFDNLLSDSFIGMILQKKIPSKQKNKLGQKNFELDQRRRLNI
jgi:hypothetical protein